MTTRTCSEPAVTPWGRRSDSSCAQTLCKCRCRCRWRCKTSTCSVIDPPVKGSIGEPGHVDHVTRATCRSVRGLLPIASASPRACTVDCSSIVANKGECFADLNGLMVRWTVWPVLAMVAASGARPKCSTSRAGRATRGNPDLGYTSSPFQLANRLFPYFICHQISRREKSAFLFPGRS